MLAPRTLTALSNDVTSTNRVRIAA